MKTFKQMRTSFPGISSGLQETVAEVLDKEAGTLGEGYKVKDKGLHKALMIMRQIQSTAEWVDVNADKSDDKYQHAYGEGAIFPKENIIKFSKDLEKVCKKWSKACGSWKNHGEAGGTDSIHIKN